MNMKGHIESLAELGEMIQEFYHCQLFPEVREQSSGVIAMEYYTYADGRRPKDGESPLQGQRTKLPTMKITGSFEKDYFILSTYAMGIDHVLFTGTYNDIKRFLQRKIMEKKLTK